MNFSQAPLLIKLDILHNYFSPSIIFLNIIKTFLTEGKQDVVHNIDAASHVMPRNEASAPLQYLPQSLRLPEITWHADFGTIFVSRVVFNV